MVNSNENTPLVGRAGSFPNPRLLWRAGAILVAAGIVSDAFGAHAIKSRVTPQQAANWATASRYLMYSGFGTLLISMHPRFAFHKFAAPAFISGALIFTINYGHDIG